MTLLMKMRFALWTLIGIVWVRFKKVRMAGYSYFLGLPHINNLGKISIGPSCMFISSKTGNAVGLNHCCMLTTQSKSSCIQIGSHCGFSGASIWCFKSIKIGDYVKIGANCLIMDGDAHQDDPRAGSNKEIVIEDNVWLGANVVVMKGVRIGRNSLIGINSVVTKDIPSNVIAAGNPCRVIRELTQQQIEEIESR